MIKKFSLFESIEDDYYEVLIKLEELSKNLNLRHFSRLSITEKKENDYIIFIYNRRLGSDILSPFDPVTKTFPIKTPAKIVYEEKIKFDVKNLTLTWIDIKEGEYFIKYMRFYYAPKELNFKNVNDVVDFLDDRYWHKGRSTRHFDGRPRKHPVGRRDFLWEEPQRNTITKNDPYGEEEWEYDYPFDDEED